ncbi:hypothetical protein CVT25_003623 [Psilocybe cyanescens]|uniref:Niemann-Pick C1 N-terminal domain-containing protein n=1 Tax=Psilocybe cyanescens TaxID=93625 RepID=A0A409WPB8_PSICY|nr:hypothetical protein CVT25_003623 [Psilocybe cyanescens]
MLRSLIIVALSAFLSFQTFASPALLPIGDSPSIQQRATDPTFPDSPPSCPICAKGYSSIQGCAQAAPVLANFSMIIFNPGAFVDVIKCACADTFNSVFPQCVDCFIQTNQTDVLDTSDLPDLVGSIRRICSLESTLLGNVSGADATLTGSNAPLSTSTSWGTVTKGHTTYLKAGVLFAGMGIVAAL